MSSNFCQIGQLTTKLASLERLDINVSTFTVAIDQILFKLADYKDMHKILDELKFQADLATYCGASCL